MCDKDVREEASPRKYNPGRVDRKKQRLCEVCMVLPVWIEHTTSPLPRECSTTELRQRAASGANSGDPPTTNGAAVSAALGSKPLPRCAQHLALRPVAVSFHADGGAVAAFLKPRSACRSRPRDRK